MPSLTSMKSSKLITYLKSHLHLPKSNSVLTNPETTHDPPPEEISIPLCTNLQLIFDTTDGRYDAHPLISFETLRANSTASFPNQREKSIARANVNTHDMCASELYDCMWRVRSVQSPKSHDNEEEEGSILPVDYTHLNANRYTSNVPSYNLLGQVTPGHSNWKYEGHTSRPISIGMLPRNLSVRSRRRGVGRNNAELLNTAFDFKSPDTTIVRSHKEVGRWNLEIDQSRSEDVSKVLGDVLDESTKRRLGELSRGGEYRLDRITWEGEGWDDRDSEDQKVKVGRAITGGMFVDADWIWKRVSVGSDENESVDTSI
ncbi:hypothetical protein I302_103572 [Kwoniella bestiolae CBS 10118]|uniref:Uncharacterized protein n=1 Tax=Kwoniella bestiolae CBS 10118 TaxID=1296100 RepID=A0A1B9G8T2_9TREE|nr:hypothetical protein I302_02274 [Kwoniella bestiolae CBS 10118]OCF27432.1 hypothetical protein I302_02274 [Kwoniella bestiolae CBS 10118]